MAAMRLSARGGAASATAASVTSIRVPGSVCVGGNCASQPLFNSGGNFSATGTQRQSISLSNRKMSDTALGSVANCSTRTKFVSSLLTTAAMVTTCQAENQAVQNKQKVVSKAPSGSKEKAFTPNLDDGGIGGGPGGGDGGGGGGGGGGSGGGGFLFWGLLMLLGFIRDNESDKPYKGRKANTKAMKAKKRHQLQV